MLKQKSKIGERASDKITRIVGSWKFIIIQSIILLFWIILNITAWINHWDPYPFIFLNLALSFQAAYTAPIILMSENRELEREKRKTAIDLATDRKAEREINDLKLKIEKLEKEKIDEILKILKK
jgi:uncharacterized membrane protein